MRAPTPFSWLPDDLASLAREALDAPMPRGRERLAFTAPPDDLSLATVGGKPHVVFVAYYPYVSTVKKSLALREAGYRTTLLCLCAREDAAPQRFFDQVHEVADYRALLALLRGAGPSAVSVHVPHQILAAIALEAAPACPVVLDVYDAQYFMHRDPAHPEVRLEGELLRRADAVVHKMPPAAVAVLRRVHGFTARDALVHSLPCRAFFAEPSAEPGPPWKLAYAGGVMPRKLALAAGHENQIFDPFIQGTAEAGLAFTMFVNQNARNMFFAEHAAYLAMADRLPDFDFRPGLPFFELPRALAGHHFGILYDNVALSSYREEIFTYNMSTKIFSYLEAGLPLLVYDRFDYIVSLVEKHGLGLVYSLDDIPGIARLIAAADYPALRAGVARFREDFELAANRPVLQTLYGPASSDPGRHPGVRHGCHRP